jgi:hypothetical protein
MSKDLSTIPVGMLGFCFVLFCLELTLKFGLSCWENSVQGNPLLCGWSTGTECPGDPPLPLMANVNASTQCKLTIYGSQILIKV